MFVARMKNNRLAKEVMVGIMKEQLRRGETVVATMVMTMLALLLMMEGDRRRPTHHMAGQILQEEGTQLDGRGKVR